MNNTFNANASEIDSLDIQVLLLLQEDGRRSNAEIARLVGISEPTVRKRIDRMTADGIIKVVAVLNPKKTSYCFDVLILFQTHPGKSQQVGAQLEAEPNAVYLAHTTGRFDIIGEFLFQSEEDLMRFMSDRVGEIGGVMSTEVVCVLQTRKINYDWKLPAEFIEAKLQSDARGMRPTRRTNGADGPDSE